MNFSYILYTGDSTATGSISQIRDYGQLSSIHEDFISSKIIVTKNGKEIKQRHHFRDDVITGQYSSKLSLNSQTLNEGPFDIITGRNAKYYSIPHASNYFIDQENSDNKFLFDYSLSVGTEDIVLYDKRPYESGIQQTHTAGTSWNTNISNLYNSIDSKYSNLDDIPHMFEVYNVFANGQKIQYAEYPDDGVQAQVFVVLKRENSFEVASDAADYYSNTGFVEHNTNFYLNGLEQSAQDCMEMYTGVYMIETGVQSSVPAIKFQKENHSL